MPEFAKNTAHSALTAPELHHFVPMSNCPLPADNSRSGLLRARAIRGARGAAARGVVAPPPGWLPGAQRRPSVRGGRRPWAAFAWLQNFVTLRQPRRWRLRPRHSRKSAHGLRGARQPASTPPVQPLRSHLAWYRMPARSAPCDRLAERGGPLQTPPREQKSVSACWKTQHPAL